MGYKFLHVSDTHLARDYPKVGGLARAQAYNHAFNQVINAAIEQKVDFIIHTGDLFSTNRPFPRAVQYVIRQWERLHQQKIPLILVRGNHDGSYIGLGVFSGTACDYVISTLDPPRETIDLSKELPDYPILIDPGLYERYPESGLAVKAVRFGEDLEIRGSGYGGVRAIETIRKHVLSDLGDSSIPKFLIFHDFISGLTAIPPGTSAITVDELVNAHESVCYIGTGHDHVFRQRELKNVKLVCAGSTEAYDFEEANKQHGYIIGEYDNRKVTYKWYELDPLHYMRYETIKTEIPRTMDWFKEQVQEKINEFLSVETPKKKIIKIMLKGGITQGETLHQLDTPRLEEMLQEENVLFSAIDISGIELPEMGDYATPTGTITPKTILSRLNLTEKDQTLAIQVFEQVQQFLDDDKNVTSTGNLRKPVNDTIQEMIYENWEMKEEGIE